MGRRLTGILALLATAPLLLAMQFDGPPRPLRPRPAPVEPLPPIQQPAPTTTLPPIQQPATTSALPPITAPAPNPSLPPIATPPAPPPVTAPGLARRKGDVQLTIRSDNPGVAITGVYEAGKAYTSIGLGTSTVQLVLSADADEGDATPCNTEEFEVRLSNGLFWHPIANFCDTGHVLAVPTARPPMPSPLPRAVAGFAWQLVSRGNERQLVYGISQSDATAFVASCPRGYGRVVAKFFADAGPKPAVELFGPEELLRYDLNLSPPASEEEGAANSVELFANDAFWNLMRRGLKLPYRIGNGPYAMLDTSTGKARIEQLLAWCAAR